MNIWEEMYALLCAAASEALDLLPENEGNQAGRRVLQDALYAAEEYYILSE